MSKNTSYSSPAWLLIGIHGSKPGTLRLNNGRLSYSNDDQQCLFDVPVSEVKDLDFPWYYFGGGVNFKIGADKYRLSFVQPHQEYGLAEGLEVAKVWKPLLTEK
ncbi:hypothetical protein IAD21_00752 [Abditibacteriota bacterium]|nr:hypothetical protein IAD21_00752 [Abditibacteriota bacterium]